MKKLIIFLASAIIILSFSSCRTYEYSSSGGGCGAWWPKKFEKDRRAIRMANYSRHRQGYLK